MINNRDLEDDETAPAKLLDGSLSSFTDEEQLQHELQEYKEKCRTLESENCGLVKMIPQLKDAHGKDYTKELMAAFQREKAAKDKLEKLQQEQYEEAKMFAIYKAEQEEMRRKSNYNFIQMKSKAEQEERENRDLRKIIAENGIEIEPGPGGVLRQKNNMNQQSCSNTYVNGKFGYEFGIDAKNYIDPQFNRDKCTSSAIPMLQPCSLHAHRSKNNKRSFCNRNTVFAGTIAFSLATVLVILFIHIYLFMRGRQ